jgi:hypothetical protein
MQFVLLLVLLLAACKRPEPAPEMGTAAADGPCRSLLFEGERFTVCRDRRAVSSCTLPDATAGPTAASRRSSMCLAQERRRSASP